MKAILQILFFRQHKQLFYLQLNDFRNTNVSSSNTKELLPHIFKIRPSIDGPDAINNDVSQLCAKTAH